MTDLTPKETIIVKMVCMGNRNKRIAELLGVSVRTIESHRERVRKKWKVNNRPQLIEAAKQHKIYEGE